MLDREDFPYCVFCDEKVSFVSIEAQSILYYCRCGEVVEVKHYEELL